MTLETCGCCTVKFQILLAYSEANVRLRNKNFPENFPEILDTCIRLAKLWMQQVNGELTSASSYFVCLCHGLRFFVI